MQAQASAQKNTLDRHPKHTLILTGATSGLGFETVACLAREHPDWHLVLAGRDPERNQASVERIRSTTSGASLEAQTLDLASLESVREFSRWFAHVERPPLEALVCNAGLQFVTERLSTVDGFEPTFQINHLGHFLLAHLLLPTMRAPGQIVFLGSSTHDPDEHSGLPAPRFVRADWVARPELDPDPPQDAVREAGRRAYATSKLCNVMTALELDRFLQRTGRSGIRAYVYDPGMMPGSGLARTYAGYERLFWRFVFPVMRLWDRGVTTVGRSAGQLTRLLTDPGYAAVRGQIIGHDGLREQRPAAAAQDPVRVADLWETSLRLTGLNDSVLAG